MSEQRLIDANKVETGFDELCQSPYFKNDVNAKHVAETLMDLCVRSDSHEPNTIDPETLPIVQQLREKLMLTEANQQHFKEERDEFKFKMREVAEAANAEIDRRNKTIAELREKLELVTAERDSYKIFFNDITKCGDCNDCGKSATCEFMPKVGETTRYNCPLWTGR